MSVSRVLGPNRPQSWKIHLSSPGPFHTPWLHMSLGLLQPKLAIVNQQKAFHPDSLIANYRQLNKPQHQLSQREFPVVLHPMHPGSF